MIKKTLSFIFMLFLSINIFISPCLYAESKIENKADVYKSSIEKLVGKTKNIKINKNKITAVIVVVIIAAVIISLKKKKK